jgi:hypothetical protein
VVGLKIDQSSLPGVEVMNEWASISTTAIRNSNCIFFSIYIPHHRFICEVLLFRRLRSLAKRLLEPLRLYIRTHVTTWERINRFWLKFLWENLQRKILDHTNFYLYWTILTTTLRESVSIFWAYFFVENSMYNFTFRIVAAYCCNKKIIIFCLI